MIFKLFRATISFLIFIAVFFFSYWLLWVQIIPETLYWIDTLAAFMTAAIAAFAGFKTLNNANGLVATIVSGALIIGATGFIVGFFGPMIFAPESNQGPLLGLFITGPLGFVAGAIGGAVFYHLKDKPRQTE